MLIAVWYSQSFLFLAVINILVMALLERKEERERISFFHSGVVLHLCMIWYVGYKRAYWDRVCQTSGMFFTSQENEGCEVCTTQSGCSSNKSSSSKMTDCSGSTIKLHHSWYFPLSTDFFLDFLHDTHTHTQVHWIFIQQISHSTSIMSQTFVLHLEILPPGKIDSDAKTPTAGDEWWEWIVKLDARILLLALSLTARRSKGEMRNREVQKDYTDFYKPFSSLFFFPLTFSLGRSFFFTAHFHFFHCIFSSVPLLPF